MKTGVAPTTRSALTAALDDMLKARQQRLLSLGQKARCDLSMRVLDEMLEDLEQLNLRGVRRVPGSFEPRITALAEVLVPGTGDLPPMRTNISPVRLMDMVFDLQERVLEVRSGGPPAVLDDEVDYEAKEPVAS